MFGFVDLIGIKPHFRNPPKRGISMETYRIHEHGNDKRLVPSGQGQPASNKAPEQPAFDARLSRLRELAGIAADQSKRLDAAVMRLSGLSPPRSGSDEANKVEPVNVLARFDLVLDYLHAVIQQNQEYVARLETL